jgi:hypothetical protein
MYILTLCPLLYHTLLCYPPIKSLRGPPLNGPQLRLPSSRLAPSPTAHPHTKKNYPHSLAHTHRPAPSRQLLSKLIRGGDDDKTADD